MSRRTRDEAGVATVLVAMFFAAVFFGLAALTVDVARWYLEGHRIQKAADAAALAGVTWMPQDLAQATLVARDMSARNGYPNTGNTTVVVAQGSKPSQLKVTVSSTVDNVFGAAFGKETTTITRHAVADYTGPQPMGSPCNTMGNEPAGGNANSGPIASQLSVPAGATCPRIPQFWASHQRAQRAQDPGRRVRRALLRLVGIWLHARQPQAEQGVPTAGEAARFQGLLPDGAGASGRSELEHHPAALRPGLRLDDLLLPGPAHGHVPGHEQLEPVRDDRRAYAIRDARRASSAAATPRTTATKRVQPRRPDDHVVRPPKRQRTTRARCQPPRVDGCTRQYPGYRRRRTWPA